jgi:hypothetical protein
MMSTRPFLLPQDIDLMNSLVIDGFKYPENPKWNVQEDEIQARIDRVNTEARFRIPMIMPLFGKFFEAAGGSHSERFAIYAADDQAVGVGQYTYRTRAGGANYAKLSIDPGHPILAGFTLHHVFSKIQKVSPGRRIELSFDDWESALIQCAAEIGCEKRFGSHRMGLRF